MIDKQNFTALLGAIREQADDDLNFSFAVMDYCGGRVGTAQNTRLISEVVKYLDSITECCSYVHCWVFEINFGRVKGTTEMSCELGEIKNNEDLYDFIIKKRNKV